MTNLRGRPPRQLPASPGRAPLSDTPVTPPPTTGDAFFRHIVAGIRNGVLAITRNGRLALINDEAYRIFGVTPHASDLARPAADVLSEHPDIVRVLTTVFDLHLLPNRVELRLRPTGKVIGYTLALVRDDEGPLEGQQVTGHERLEQEGVRHARHSRAHEIGIEEGPFWSGRNRQRCGAQVALRARKGRGEPRIDLVRRRPPFPTGRFMKRVDARDSHTGQRGRGPDR